jgi:hypothetical protein
MLELDSDALEDRQAAPASAAGRRRRTKSVLPHDAEKPQDIQAFPGWARISEQAARGDDPAFFAGAGLALLDRHLAAAPPFAGALRQRLALRAATACARMARFREDERGLRDAEHLSAGANPGPAGRLHRLWRLCGSRSPASRSLRLEASTLAMAAELVGLADAANFDALAGALRDVGANAPHPLAAAAGAGVAAVDALEGAPPVDVETFALWAADLALAQNFGWDAPVPLLATTIAQPALLRGGSGKRPRPGDLNWAEAAAFAYALAAQDAHALAGELARRAEKLLAAAPTLRAKRASRVVELLLSDDALSPARAAKAAGLSDRAARRLFDRLVELGAARELSGRPSFRLYGL